MFWTGFIVGMFVGAAMGVVVAGLLVSARKNDAQVHESEPLMDQIVLDDIDDVQGEVNASPQPLTYLDRYPHS